jgi:hypothetical protein
MTSQKLTAAGPSTLQRLGPVRNLLPELVELTGIEPVTS